jgi:hypothetical protein
LRNPDKIVLKYVGDGTHIPGIPSRDLTAAEVDKFGLTDLIASGLYVEIKAERRRATRPQEDTQ